MLCSQMLERERKVSEELVQGSSSLSSLPVFYLYLGSLNTREIASMAKWTPSEVLGFVTFKFQYSIITIQMGTSKR